MLSLWWGVPYLLQRRTWWEFIAHISHALYIIQMLFFALNENGRMSRDHCSFVCSSLNEERHFSEDFLNNMSLDSQLEWFNCFWIHTGGILCKGQKAATWVSSPRLCSVVASEVFTLSGWWLLAHGWAALARTGASSCDWCAHGGLTTFL